MGKREREGGGSWRKEGERGGCGMVAWVGGEQWGETTAVEDARSGRLYGTVGNGLVGGERMKMGARAGTWRLMRRW